MYLGKEIENTIIWLVSRLTYLLENLKAEDTNPWLEYGKYDASSNLEAKTRHGIITNRKLTEYIFY